MYNTILLTYYTIVQQISRTYSTCITETLYLLNTSSSFFVPTKSWQPPFYSPFLFDYFRFLHVSGILQYLSFCDWLISFSIMTSKFIHLVAHGRISFIFKAEYFLYIQHVLHPFISLPLPQELPRCNLNLAPVQGRQGKTKDRGRSLQIGR